MKRYWFKAKQYGYGWYPATWEGWLVLTCFLALIVVNFLRIDSSSHSVSDTLLVFIPQTAVLVFLLIALCAATGEKASWRWPKK
jgi:hypothetical protein